MRNLVAFGIVGVSGAVSVALGGTGHLLPSAAAALTGILGVLVWLRLSDPKF